MSKTPKFTLLGRLVTHTSRPRLTFHFVPRADGGWAGMAMAGLDDIDQTDPAAAARDTAKLALQAGAFFASCARQDWIQERVSARARELGLTASAIAKATGDAVSENHIRCYLAREKSMGSHKLLERAPTRAKTLRLIMLYFTVGCYYETATSHPRELPSARRACKRVARGIEKNWHLANENCHRRDQEPAQGDGDGAWIW